MKALRSMSIGFAFSAAYCVGTSLSEGLAGAFDGGSAATLLCGLFIGGFALAGILLTGGRHG